MKKLQDRTALVTGAGSGIGRATALALAKEGCRLALVDVDAAGLAETARQVEAIGRPVSQHRVDVSDRAAMLALPAAVHAAHGPVQVLVNNAGVTCTAGFHEHDLEDFEWVIGVNLWGVVHGCKAFLPDLLAADEAHVVNISSMFGIVGIPSQTSYCTSKFAVRGFSESLQEELQGTHVGITVVHPGGVATNIARNARTSDESTRERTVRFFEEKAISPDVAAARIVAAIKAGQPRLLITPESHLSDYAKRLMPVLGNRAVVRLIIRLMGMEDKLVTARQGAIEAARSAASIRAG